MPSASSEDYLKAVYALQSRGGRVTTSLVSERLRVAAPSVTEMLKKLAVGGLVTYRPYRGVELTPEGTHRALRILRRHRLWELFLVEVLHYRWDEIHEEAERLEHSTSAKLEERLDALLGHPALDPHGDAIPSARGAIREIAAVPLAEVATGTTVEVLRVSDLHPGVLQQATRMGIRLRRRVRICERRPSDGSVRVEVGRREHVIGPRIAGQVFVRTL